MPAGIHSEVFEDLQFDIHDRHHGPKPRCHAGGIGAHRAAPEDEDVAGGNPGHSGQQVRPGCLILVVANP